MDDHLRNHGFLYDSARRGWRLSPTYDLNPVPRDVKPPYLCTMIDEHNNAASFEVVLGTVQGCIKLLLQLLRDRTRAMADR